MAQSSKDLCYQDLKRRILTLDLAPGVDLDEVSLSAQYGISRTPLREVLQRLAGAGYVRSESNRSAQVASMDITTMRVFFQTAPMIYANIARLAADNWTPHQMVRLQAAQSRFAEDIARGDASAAALSNHSFHAIIGEMAQNPYLTACLDRLAIDHTRLSQTFYRPSAPSEAEKIDTAVAQHDAMIAAIEAGDADQVVDLTLQHWDLSRDRIEHFVRPDPLPHDLSSWKERAHAL